MYSNCDEADRSNKTIQKRTSAKLIFCYRSNRSPDEGSGKQREEASRNSQQHVAAVREEGGRVPADHHQPEQNHHREHHQAEGGESMLNPRLRRFMR